MLRRGKYVAKEFRSPPVREPTTPFSGGVFVFGDGHGWSLSSDVDRRSNAYSRLRSHELLFPLTGVAGTCRGGGLSESRSGNERGQGQGGEKRLHDTSPCYGPSSDDLCISAATNQPALAVAHRVRKVDRGTPTLIPRPGHVRC